MPPRAPQVIWDGKQLTIKSENATLAEILTAVRARTKAQIEIPPGAGAERVAADLGPGTARDVLTTLLTGSKFDYVIMASPKDEAAIQTVLLTPRGKADENATVVASNPGMRRMPGYPQVRRETAQTSPEAPAESPNPEPAAAAEGAAAGTDSPPVTTSAGADHSPDNAAPAPASSAPVPDPSQGAPSVRPSTSTPSTPAVESGSGQGAATEAQVAPIEQMRQDLQRMYQQRMQMQAQQNHANTNSAN
jgi:hypothetical protein